MAREVRFILFTAEETRSAVSEFLFRRAKDMKPVYVDEVDLEERDGTVIAQARVTRGGLPNAFAGWRAAVTSPERAVVALEGNELLASILIYCRRVQIPLSSRSSKRLEISNGCLVLATALNTRTSQPKVEGGKVTHAGTDMNFATPHFA